MKNMRLIARAKIVVTKTRYSTITVYKEKKDEGSYYIYQDGRLMQITGHLGNWCDDFRNNIGWSALNMNLLLQSERRYK